MPKVSFGMLVAQHRMRQAIRHAALACFVIGIFTGVVITSLIYVGIAESSYISCG